MTRLPLQFLLVALIAACAPLPDDVETPPEVRATPAEDLPPPPPPSARTVEEFDTTSAAERQEAATPDQGGTLLGSEITSLGDPTRPGFWLETPLVSEPSRGRVALANGDGSVEVDLLPASAGSRLSLPALRVLNVPLTDLPTVAVYAF